MSRLTSSGDFPQNEQCSTSPCASFRGMDAPSHSPCTLGEAAWVVSDCAAHPLVGLGTARWLCRDVIASSLQPYGCASSGVIGAVAASLLPFSIPRTSQRVHTVYQLGPE